MSIDRRSLLQMLSASALSASLPASIARALAIPANNKTGTLADVEHIVFLMQENRAFDHYLGTLNGVRGFNDPRAVKLHGGNSVFYQPVVAGTPAPYVLPYHPTAPNLGLQFIEDLEHDWDTTHVAWNVGNWDQWVPAKSPLTMVYLDRTDIPYHYALADAFTVCDAYHASLLGPTDPNRYHMFTGWVGNDGSGGGPVVDNAEAGYSWLTFPEILQDGGITWRVYQDIGTGLNAAGSYGDDSADPLLGNYGDNSLLYFDQYRNASTSSPLYQQAVTGTDVAVSGTIFDRFRADCAGATLPQVSWICAPEAYSEHPNWPANYGAYYVSQILDALTANPEVWSKTVLFVMYDENDGFFDHMVPPTPPQSAAEGLSTVPITNEIFPGGTDTTSGVSTPGPYGLGARVPMFVISPWSKGGWVCSEVFDHTSLIQFVQARFGTEAAPLTNPNVTPWRKAVCGNLTSAFNFVTPNDAVVSLPSTAAYIPPNDDRQTVSYIPLPPVVQTLPLQESGTRPARPVPYTLNVAAAANLSNQIVTLAFSNTGAKTAVFQVRCVSVLQAPRSYTVSPNATLTDTWEFAADAAAAYDLSVYGPNGFFRHYRGGVLGLTATNLESTVNYDASADSVTLVVKNAGALPASVQVQNAYAGTTTTNVVASGTTFSSVVSLATHAGWYDFILTVESDLTFQQEIAGHLETGRPSTTDPAMG
jgi:phospholipase C